MDQEQAVRQCIERVSDVASRLGMHAIWANARLEDDDGVPVMATVGGGELDPSAKLMLRCIFVLGDEAFSDRVQHPERYTDAATIAEIEHATYKADAERILRRLAETGEILD